MVEPTPPRPERYEANLLHESLGRAIITWQEVEAALFSVFRRVCGCADKRVASAIFYSPHDFSEKLKCTHNAARFALKKHGLLDDWIALRKRLLNASEVRNALAHFTVVHVTEINERGETVSSKPILHPNFLDVTEAFRTRKPTVRDLDIHTVITRTDEFTALIGDVKKFAEKIPLP